MTKVIKCRDCDNSFEAPKASHKILCEACKIKSHKSHFKKIIIKKFYCKKCGVYLREEVKKGSKSQLEDRTYTCNSCRNSKDIILKEIKCKHCEKVIRLEPIKVCYQTKLISFISCDECIKKQRNEREFNNKVRFLNKIIELGLDNMSSKEIARVKNYIKNQDVVNKYNKIDIFNIFFSNKDILNRNNLSERMKNNNPCFKDEVKTKIRRALTTKYKTGELDRRIGIARYNFKGSSDIKITARRALYTVWVRPIMERDNFTCTQCGSKKELQVHHIKRYNDIVNIIEERLDTSFVDRTQLNYPQFHEAVKLIVDEHKIEDGITVCKECHASIDYYYRPNKGVKKNERKTN